MNDSNDLQNRHELIKAVLGGDFRSVARLLTLVESGSRDAVLYLRELFPHTGRSFTIGITGAPGSGKSTLIDRLAESFRAQEKRIGIIAVDPTSPFTGGAILGDRIRMQSRSLDPGIFIRSMATRGHVGGLARTTADVLTVMDAAGFEVVLIETIGVGQGDVEIVKTADATLLLLVPGMGDDIQLMKAGIMEIGDIFIINKADHAGADQTEAELSGLLSLGARPDGWNPPIIRTVASEGTGLRACVDAIEQFRSFLEHSEFRKKETVKIQRDRLLELACLQARETLLRDTETAARIQELALLIADRKIDPFTAADLVIKIALGPKNTKSVK